MTRLCVPVLVSSADQARRDALVAVEHGADLIELRLDALPPESLDGECFECKQLVGLIRDLRAQNVSCILTFRHINEGGRSDTDDETRFEQLAAIVHEVSAWVDLEWRPMSRSGGWPMVFLDLAGEGQKGTRFITSAHDFEGRPSDLLSLYAEMSQSRADVVKLAWRARSLRDNVEAFELLREAAKPTIAICMGEAGLPSRVLAKKFGAYLSFAAAPDGTTTADGQLPVDVMKRLYRWDAINRGTRVYGVVAHPVAHSRSPHVHNAAFTAADFDGVYLPLLVQPGYESFKAFMETWLTFVPLDLSGLSITLPHKENALRYAREKGAQIDELAERVGAVNTMIIDRDEEGPKLRASNTDFGAMLATVTETLKIKRDALNGMSVGIIGAGGTGRTAVAAFASAGAEVTVYNRTRGRADELASEFDGTAGASVQSAALGDARNGKHRVWINTTSVGMAPDVEANPLGDALPNLNGDSLVFDTIYNPTETDLLRRAREADARTVNGELMFLHQAAAQFELWARQPAPLDVMRKAFRA